MGATAQPATAEPSEEHCVAITPRRRSESKQGHHIFEGVSSQSAGSRGLCMHVVVFPPGARARAHLHEEHESAIYMVEGEVVCWYGERLQHQFTICTGELAYIPAGVPHLPINASATAPVTCIVARTDPNEQESVVLLPELEKLVHTRPPSAVVVELDRVRG